MDLSWNNFKIFPEEISGLPNLEFLSFAHNNISIIPPSIKHLSSLKLLELQDNKLTNIAEEIGKKHPRNMSN